MLAPVILIAIVSLTLKYLKTNRGVGLGELDVAPDTMADISNMTRYIGSFASA